ncbi:hypothetical protein [Argonema galeatum]|nr:hypothetical protein [Argonema galeatum]
MKDRELCDRDILKQNIKISNNFLWHFLWNLLWDGRPARHS